MDEEFETIELEYSEEDILYYLVDEDDNEIGFVVEIDGEEVECFYEDVDGDEYELAEDDDFQEIDVSDLAELADGEVVEMEIDLDAIDHYLFDEDGNEVGFVIVEDGVEVECYYEEGEDEDDDDDDGEPSELEQALDAGLEEARKLEPKKAEDHGYLYKMASIAGHKGNQARKKAEVQLDKVHSKVESGIDKASEAADAQAQKIKGKAAETDLGITRDDVKATTADLNAIAKEGAETAKELKEAYDDIMDSFGFLVPKKVRRRMP